MVGPGIQPAATHLKEGWKHQLANIQPNSLLVILQGWMGTCECKKQKQVLDGSLPQCCGNAKPTSDSLFLKFVHSLWAPGLCDSSLSQPEQKDCWENDKVSVITAPVCLLITIPANLHSLPPNLCWHMNWCVLLTKSKSSFVLMFFVCCDRGLNEKQHCQQPP